MGKLTPQGFIAERLDAIVARLEDGFRSIYGDDISVAPDDPDGQLIGLIAQALADLEELASAIYRAIDPDYAGGAWLEQRAAYAGLLRRLAQFSYLRSVLMYGTAGRTIPAGSIVSDDTRTKWQLVSDVTLGAEGSARADFRSVELGAYSVPADTQLTIETIVLGWSRAVTLGDAEVGREEELDPELRARFMRSRARPAQNSTDAIEAKLGELADVREVICLENWTDAYDANGLPPHSINAIVDGGDDDAIARIIFDNKPSGTGMLGGVEQMVMDRKRRLRRVRYDRPQVINCAARIVVERSANYSAVDEEGIKAALAEYSQGIGRDVKLSRLYTPINTIPGFSVETFLIGRVGEPLIEANIPIGVRQRARFLAEDIEVVVL